MADQNDLPALHVMPLSLYVHFGDEGACGVEVEQLARPGRGGYRLRHPVGRKDHRGVGIWNLVELLHKNGAFCSQGVHNVTVVDDLVAYIDGRPVFLECQLDDLDGAIHTSTEAAWGGQQDCERRAGALAGSG